MDKSRLLAWLKVWRGVVFSVTTFLVLALTLTGAPRTAAELPPGSGLQWGPSGPLEAMREPLRHSEVLQALFLAVDERGIASRLLGDPALLMLVDDASHPSEIDSGFVDTTPQEIMTEKARIILDDAGITPPALTIASDPKVPEARQVAEAIAADLRANLGMEVTVVDGEADLLVTRALGPSPPAAQGAVSVEVTCNPDTFRPDEWVVVECSTKVSNHGETTLIPSVRIDAGDTPPSDYQSIVISAELDGKLAGGSPWAPYFGPAELAAGETSTSRAIVLVKAGEGTHESSVSAYMAREVAATSLLRYTASPAAAEPPRDLEVTKKLVAKQKDVTNGSVPRQRINAYATYETTITNRSSQPVSSLRITDGRSSETALLDSQPAPVLRDLSAGIASWDLSSFGRQSLGPGESLVLRTTYGPVDESEVCFSMLTAGVVETGSGGKVQRYAVAPVSGDLPSYCYQGGGGGEGSLSTELADGGEGPTGGYGGRWPWVAACLATVGVALTGVSLVVRGRMTP